MSTGRIGCLIVVDKSYSSAQGSSQTAAVQIVGYSGVSGWAGAGLSGCGQGDRRLLCQRGFSRTRIIGEKEESR